MTKLENYLTFARKSRKKRVSRSHWPTRHLVNRELFGQISEDMEQCMPWATGKTNQLHSPYWELQTRFSCWKQSNNVSEGFFRMLLSLGDLTDSKSTSRGVWCLVRNQSFVPNSWSCKKPIAAPLGNTEAENISWDASLRRERILGVSGTQSLTCWNSIVQNHAIQETILDTIAHLPNSILWHRTHTSQACVHLFLLSQTTKLWSEW